MANEHFGSDKVVARGLSQVTRALADIKSSRKRFGTIRRVVVECDVHGANPLADLMLLVKDTVVMVQLSFTSTEAEVPSRPQRSGHVSTPTSWPLDRLTDAFMLCNKLESVQLSNSEGMLLTTVRKIQECIECWPTLHYLDIEHLSFDWCFEGVVPAPRRLPSGLRTLKVHMEEFTQSNHFCETIVAASAAELRHLKLQLGDATPESLIRMFKLVARTLTHLDCRSPGCEWRWFASALREFNALEQLTLPISALEAPLMLPSLVAVTTRRRLARLTIGNEESTSFLPTQPDKDRSGYSIVLLELAKTIHLERVQISQQQWDECADRARRHSPAATRKLAEAISEWQRRGALVELI